jgi:hypothetical protein
MRKEMHSPKAIALAVVMILATIGLIVLVVSKLPTQKPLSGGSQSIEIVANGKKVTVFSDGSVFSEGVLVDTWDKEKTDAFFDYYNKRYSKSETGDIAITFVSGGDSHTSYAPGSDELTNIIIKNETGGGGGGGGNGSPTPTPGDIGSYFNSPTPTPLPYDSPSPLPEGIPSWCKHWLLSYCADTPAPSYSPTPTPVPTGPTPLPPDCNNPGNQQTGRTVISNELCVPTPTP